LSLLFLKEMNYDFQRFQRLSWGAHCINSYQLSQEESRSISENVTWGQRKRMVDGKVSLPYRKAKQDSTISIG